MEEFKISLLLFCCVHMKGMATIIFPSEIALACSGGQLELICNISGKVLEWSFYLTYENKTNATKYVRSFELNTNTTANFTVNSTEFNLSTRSIGMETSLLTSTLLIKDISNNLNGTEVTCTDRTAKQSTSTSINIISRPNVLQQHHPEVNISLLSERFSSTNVTAILHWFETSTLNSRLDCHVAVVPQARVKQLMNKTVELTLDYNTVFNVSFVCIHPCKQNNVITSTELYYTNCGNPSTHINDESITVVGYDSNPATEKTKVTFLCPPGLTIIGPTSTACKRDGEWEADLGKLKCLVMGSADSEIVIGSIIGVIILVAVLVVTVIMSLVIIAKQKVGSLFHKRNFNVTVNELFTTEQHPNCGDTNYTKNVDEEGLVYAEVSHPSFSQQMKLINLVDMEDPIEYAQISHRALVDEVTKMRNKHSLKENHINDDIPKITLDNLLIQLKPHVTDKWYTYGEALGIEKEVLDNYAQKCSPDDCIVETLDYWLRNHPDEPTWKEIAQALKTINLPQIAYNIEIISETGKQPVEVDMDSIPQLQGAAHANVTTDVTTKIPESRSSNYKCIEIRGNHKKLT